MCTEKRINADAITSELQTVEPETVKELLFGYLYYHTENGIEPSETVIYLCELLMDYAFANGE